MRLGLLRREVVFGAKVYPCIVWGLAFIDLVFFYKWAMYIDIVPNRNSRPAILLRESDREGNRGTVPFSAQRTRSPEPLPVAVRRMKRK